MFGRRPLPDSDAVAVARRRLAVLAAQFEPSVRADERLGGVVDGRGTGAPSDRPLARATVELLDPAEAMPEPTTVGRHRRIGQARSRWRVEPHHLTVAAVVLVLAMAVAAWWVLRSAPEPRSVELANERSLPPPSPGAASAPSGPSNPAPSAGVVTDLVVDVTGKVRRPGIVELPAGSRVVDALAAAGGARAGVDTAGLNLARPIVDGEQIVVGLTVPGASGEIPPAGLPSAATTPTASAVTPVNLNTATQIELETLPGIGPVTAQSILQWRTDNGAFTSVDELLEVSGIGDITLAELEPFVYV